MAEQAAGRARWRRRLLVVGAIALTALALASIDLRGLLGWAGIGAVRVQAVEVASATVAGCHEVAARVTLDRDAPDGGARVALESTNPAATVPPHVTVPRGARSARFTVGTRRVDAARAGAVEATLGGATARTALGVRPAGVRALLLDTERAFEGEPVRARVELECPAGDDTTVRVTSAAPDVAAPEGGDVVVAAGETAAALTVVAGHVEAASSARLAASAGAGEATATLAVLPVDYGAPVRAGTFDATVVPEASGLAASRRSPGWLYVVDDDRPREVWAMRTDGSGRTRVPLAGFTGRDTESLAVGACGPGDTRPCLFVGDVGDNLGAWDAVTILRVPEPALPGPIGPLEGDTIRVAYPDGPRDAEALLVDADGTPYLVSKDAGPDGTGAARLYGADGFATGTLADLGPVPVPEPVLALAGAVVGNVVTGGDHRPGRVLLRTYDHAVEYVAPDPHAPLATFPTWPAREVPTARELQSEAVTYAWDRCGFFTAGERVGDLWFVACEP